MLRNSVIALVFTLLVPFHLHSQNKTVAPQAPRVLEGVVVERQEGPRWMGIVVESSGRKYLVTLAYNPDSHVKDPAVIGDVEAIGARVRVTYKGSEPWSSGMLAVYASRVVRLPTRAENRSSPQDSSTVSVNARSDRDSFTTYAVSLLTRGTSAPIPSGEVARYALISFNSPKDILWVACTNGYRLIQASSKTGTRTFRMDASDPTSAAGIEFSERRRYQIYNLTIMCSKD